MTRCSSAGASEHDRFGRRNRYVGRASELLSRLPKDREFAIYSGNDDSALALMLMGGAGVISVTANVAPELMSRMCAMALANDVMGAREINDRLMPLHKELFCEPNPIVPKWALTEWDSFLPESVSR